MAKLDYRQTRQRCIQCFMILYLAANKATNALVEAHAGKGACRTAAGDDPRKLLVGRSPHARIGTELAYTTSAQVAQR